MIDEYLKQILVSDYKDPTYTVMISSLDTGEECDHETITIGLTQYNPSVYDILKKFYIDIMELSPNTEQDLMDINDEASAVVDDFFNDNDNFTVNNRKLVLRSGLEYDNDQKMYRSVLNANVLDALPTSTSREKTVITGNKSDVFVFNTNDDICIPLYLKTDYNTGLSNQILMITLMDMQHRNIFDHKVMLVTDRNGHALYYPTALPTEIDEQDYISGTTVEGRESFYHANSYFYQDGIPRYLYYIRVEYPGTENYAPFSKEFEIYIAKGKKTSIDSGEF